MKRERIERSSDFLFLLQAAMIAVGAWKPEFSPFADVLPKGGIELHWMQALMLIVAVTMVITTIQSIRDRALVRQILAGTLDLNSRRSPEFARYCLWFLPKKTREPLLGDLEETFHEMVEEFGTRRARFWYYSQVLFAFCPPIYWVFKKLVGWGFLSWIVKVIRQFIP